ncbi:alpha-amylase family glycosyl hydrolase [Limibacter armeniacum]|uniref:alpha-amylase family glycosyl hydrolase n=1 Tax=Limibacter armeniacum TaxID=466084 RepID=UPI002FE61425
MNPSSRTGMGAIPFNENGNSGVTFRVWAPFASKVEVVGTFNGWGDNQIHELVSEGGGTWSRDIIGVIVGDQYKYKITNKHSNELLWKTDPRGKKIHDNDNWNAEVVDDQFDWDDINFRSPPWNEMVIYELHVASFFRQDNQVGSFQTLVEKLDYIKDLGFNAILLLPIYGFKGVNSWGYNAAFPFDIESAYGGPASFKKFINEAHKRGIAIILDIVFNHFGPEELDKCLQHFDGWKFHEKHDGIYFYPDWKGQTNFGPRPDYGRGEVRSYLRDNAMMWLNEYRVDGLRFDSTVNIRNAYGTDTSYGSIGEGWTLMQWINNEINNSAPWKISIAEDLQNNEWITKKTEEGGAGFNSQWSSYFFHMLDQNIRVLDDRMRNMFEIKSALEYLHGGDLSRNIIYINNHDECGELNKKHRLNDRIWLGNANSWVAKKRCTLAVGIVFTAPGIPMIFQGDEFFEWGTWNDSKEIDWGKRETFQGIVNLHKDLVSLRRNLKGLTKGLQGNNINVFHTNQNEKVIAFHRWYNGGMGDDVVVVANFSHKTFNRYHIGLPKEGKWKVRFNSDWNGYSADFGNTSADDIVALIDGYDGMPYSGSIGLGPYTVLILSQ